MQRYKSLWAGVIVLALTGCATIVHGGTQDIRVSSQPSGAVVRVQGMATTTPGVLKLERKGMYTLVFEKEGFNSIEVRLNKTVDGWLFGNILIGGIIGIVIDFVSGAAYKLTPAEVSTVLGQKTAVLQSANKNDVVVFADFKQLPKETRERLAARKNIS